MSYKVNKTVTTPSAFTGNISIGNVNSTEIGYLDGVTAPIQTQLNGKQASDADLTAIAGLAGNSGFLKKTAANTWTLDTNSYITGNQTITVSGDVSGSGTTSISTTLATVNSNVGTYGSATLVPRITVDAKGRITSVVDTTITLPQSAVTGLTTALNSKAPIASPTFTGTPSAPTAAAGTNTTQLATTAFVTTAVSNVIDSAPGALDTLNELAAALGDDPNFATTITNSLAGKQPLSGDLSAIDNLSGSSGFLKKTAVDTWVLDTNSYLTGNQTITLSGDVSGSGTTSISVTVADDSHNHVISNVDGLQTALDSKAPSASPVFTGSVTTPLTTAGYVTTTAGGLLGSVSSIPGTAISGNISGNAGSATVLATSRTINGTSFNGSANITTANWGNARTITLGDTGKSVNGSANVSWTLTEIGAADKDITLTAGDGLSGGGNLTANRSFAVDSTVVRTTGTQSIAGLKTITDTLTVGTSTSDPAMEFAGGTSTIGLYVLSDGTLSFQGSSGELFSISDSLLGTIFSVNDISGIPMFEIQDTGEINMAHYAGSVGIGNTSPTEKVDVTGNVKATSFIGPLTGNADTATTLQTARTINGTSFNGSANITTASWGTSRTITLGGDLTGSVSLDGSTNVTLTAAVVDDSHNHVISNIDGLQTALDGKLSTTGKAADSNLLDGVDSAGFLRSDVNDILTSTIEHSYLGTVWQHGEGAFRPVSRKTYSEAGSVGTTGSNFTDVYGEADLSSIDNDATFTYAEAWEAVESHGGRLPTLSEIMDGVGAGSGQGYDAYYLWTCTPAGPHHVWVAYGSYSSTTQRKIVDITDANEVYRTRAFFDVSRDNRISTYSSDGNLRAGDNLVWHAGNDGAGSGLDADLLDGQNGSYYQPASSALTTSTSFGGDVSGTYNSIIVADDSHNHIISNIDGLQTALDAKAPLASPSLSGTPTTPTAAAGTNTTQIASTAFVQTAVSNLVDAAPTTLNTLNELAAALGDDPNFATTVTNSIATKAPLSSPLFTGTVSISNAQSFSVDAFYGSRFGYSTAYRALVIGDTGTSEKQTVSIGFDPLNVSSGSGWTGDGREVVFRNSVEFMTPNSDNTAFIKPLKFNSTGDVLASYDVTISGHLSATTKSFDIEHPTKEGKRLKYGSLEGPEHGVYVRGVCSDTEIELPDYWSGLVDDSTITVQLTPKGSYQNLYVENIVDNKVIVGGVTGEFFFFVQAERKDIDKLVVEYGG